MINSGTRLFLVLSLPATFILTPPYAPSYAEELEPQANVVKGFPPVMPSQKGLLTEEEIEAVIEYLKTLK